MSSFSDYGGYDHHGDNDDEDHGLLVDTDGLDRFEPQVRSLLWEDIKLMLAPAEIEEVKRSLGNAMIDGNTTMFNEVAALAEILQDFQSQNDARKYKISMRPRLPDPPAKQLLKQQIRMYIDSLRSRGHGFVVTRKEKDKILYEHVMKDGRAKTLGERPLTARRAGSKGPHGPTSCRPSTAQAGSIRRGYQTPRRKGNESHNKGKIGQGKDKFEMTDSGKSKGRPTSSPAKYSQGFGGGDDGTSSSASLSHLPVSPSYKNNCGGESPMTARSKEKLREKVKQNDMTVEVETNEQHHDFPFMPNGYGADRPSTAQSSTTIWSMHSAPDVLEPISGYINVFAIEKVKDSLCAALVDEKKQLQDDIDYLSRCLEDENTYMEKTQKEANTPQPSMQDLREYGSKLEQVLLGEGGVKRTDIVADADEKFFSDDFDFKTIDVSKRLDSPLGGGKKTKAKKPSLKPLKQLVATDHLKPLSAQNMQLKPKPLVKRRPSLRDHFRQSVQDARDEEFLSY